MPIIAAPENPFGELMRDKICKRRRKQEAVDEPEECPVCYNTPSVDASCTKFVTFPCAHKTCDACFPRLSECPLCRTAKDGTPGAARQQREEADRATARAQPSNVEVVLFDGGTGDHPFSAQTTRFQVSNVPNDLLGVLPELLEYSLNSNQRRQGGRPLSFGQRQQITSRVLRFASESVRIEDVLGRRVRQRPGF